MKNNRTALETAFLQMCRLRGPDWVASVIRPLRLPGASVTPRDIPMSALMAIVRLFGHEQHPAPGVAVI